MLFNFNMVFQFLQETPIVHVLLFEIMIAISNEFHLLIVHKCIITFIN